MDSQKNPTHNTRHEKQTIKNKTDENWEKKWNNKLARV